jgi:hypothetical protein
MPETKYAVGYMADLQRLWNSTTDVELAALCEEYPDFVRDAESPRLSVITYHLPIVLPTQGCLRLLTKSRKPGLDSSHRHKSLYLKAFSIW